MTARKRKAPVVLVEPVVEPTPTRAPVLALLDRLGWFRGDSWAAWRAFLSAAFAAPEPDDAMRATFTACTGRASWPSLPAREVWAEVGRGGGKSITMARLAVAKAVTFDASRYTLAPGEVPLVMLLAADREQAQVVYRYILGALQSDPALAALIDGEPAQECIRLRNGVEIQVHTSNFRAVRGRLVLCAIGDEVAFWSREYRSNPDREVLSALRPGLRLRESLLLCISTVYSKKGVLWDAHQRYWGQDGDVMVWRAASTQMNPSLDVAAMARAIAADPVAARSEYESEFRSDLETFLPVEVVEAAVDRGVRVRERQPGALMVGFVDPSGAGGPAADSFAVAFAHPELGPDDAIESVIDEAIEVKPPFAPDAAVALVAEACQRWGVETLVGDRYAGSWPAAAFARYGIHYVPSPTSKSDLYLEALPLFTSGRVRLVDVPRLTSQLINLERRSGRAGKDSVDHPPTAGAHDDLANTVAGVAVLCQTMAADLAVAEAQTLSREEAATLRSFSRTFGLPEPPGGLSNLALEDDGVTPVDRRYADGWGDGITFLG